MNVTELCVMRLDARRWRLLKPLHYQGATDVITVPAGFVTDFATVPWWSRWLTPATGSWTLAAVVHDQLCDELNLMHAYLTGALTFEATIWDNPTVSSRDVDGLFRRIMRESGTDPVRRWLMWAGVRWGALANPARRAGWWRDAPAVLAITLPAACILAAPVVAGVWGWLR